MRCSSQKRCWVSAGMSWVVPSHLKGGEGGREEGLPRCLLVAGATEQDTQLIFT